MLSILIPTYNRAHLLEETIRRALSAMEADDELIIRDNASTDGSPELLRTIAARDPRIRLELSKTNAGPVGNWRECLRLARGEYVKLLFSDDLLFDGVFRRFREGFESGGHKVGFTSALIGPEEQRALPEYLLSEVGDSVPAALYRKLMLTNFGSVPVSPCAFIFERELFTRCFDEAVEMLKDRPEAMTTGAGIDLLIVCLAVEHAGHVYYSREPHVFFRQHAHSISTARSRLVKELYNLARKRLAARALGRASSLLLGAGYVAGDTILFLRHAVRKLSS